MSYGAVLVLFDVPSQDQNRVPLDPIGTTSIGSLPRFSVRFPGLFKVMKGGLSEINE